MALGPQHGDDEDLRRHLMGMPARPRPGMPGTGVAPVAAVPPTAPMPPPVPAVAPVAEAAGVAPAANPPARPTRLPVSPEVAQYASRMAGEPMQAPAEQAARPSQHWAALVAAIANGRSGKPHDVAAFQAMDDREQRIVDKRKTDADAAQAKAVAAEMADPGSQRSQAIRSRHAPLLKQLGLSDEEIATMSGEDVSGMSKGGDLVVTVANARAKAKAAQEAAAAEQAAMGEKRVYDAGESDRKAARDLVGHKEVAAIQAGRVGDRMVDAEGMRIGAEERAEERRLLAEKRAEERKIADEKRKAELAGKPDPESYSIPGTEVTNPQRFRQVIADDTQRRKLEDNISANATIKEGTRIMRDLLQKHGTNIDAGVRGAYDSARNMVYGGMTVLGKTGALQTTDIPRYMSSLPDITPNQQDLLALIPGQENPKLRGVQGFESTIDSVIDASLGPSGIRMSKGDAPAAAPQAAPKPDATTSATPGWKDIGSGPRRVKLPGGAIKTATPAQIEQMIADGVAVEEVQ